MSDEMQQELFTSYLLYEQDLLATSISAVCDSLDWPCCAVCPLKKTDARASCDICLARFHYFPNDICLWFDASSRREERIPRAVHSWLIAQEVGWTVSQAANSYGYGTIGPAQGHS